MHLHFTAVTMIVFVILAILSGVLYWFTKKPAATVRIPRIRGHRALAPYLQARLKYLASIRRHNRQRRNIGWVVCGGFGAKARAAMIEFFAKQREMGVVA